MKARAILAVVFLFLLAALFSTMGGCGGSSSGATSHTYAATSSVGDFIQWTLDPGAGTFSVTWNVTNTSNAITKTFTLTGTCGAADATYAYRLCTVGTTTDSASVAVGAQFQVLEVPGVAVFAHPVGTNARGNGTGKDEIHVGFTLDTNACSNTASFAGDYVMTHVSPVSNPSETERVGIYRLSSAYLASINSDTAATVLHGGFGLSRAGGAFQMVYNIGDDQGGNNGTFNGQSQFTTSCTAGVMSLVGTQMTLRSVITASGLFLFDGPQTFGGIVAAKTTTMASIDDLASKSVVIVWQNPGAVGGCSTAGGCTDLLKVTFGAKDSTGKVPATITSMRGNITPPVNFRAASDTSIPIATWHFGSVNPGYSNNALSQTYPQPANIPGLFYSDEMNGGQEIPTLIFVAKVNGKLLVFGSNSLNGTGGINNCAFSLTGAPPSGDLALTGLICEPGSGNFVGFEP